jgi:hypothetical protein
MMNQVGRPWGSQGAWISAPALSPGLHGLPAARAPSAPLRPHTPPAQDSSRSHSIFTITIEATERVGAAPQQPAKPPAPGATGDGHIRVRGGRRPPLPRAFGSAALSA